MSVQICTHCNGSGFVQFHTDENLQVEPVRNVRIGNAEVNGTIYTFLVHVPTGECLRILQRDVMTGKTEAVDPTTLLQTIESVTQIASAVERVRHYGQRYM